MPLDIVREAPLSDRALDSHSRLVPVLGPRRVGGNLDEDAVNVTSKLIDASFLDVLRRYVRSRDVIE